MSEKRRGLGRGLGALIPSTTPVARGDRPVDVFFPGQQEEELPGTVPVSMGQRPAAQDVTGDDLSHTESKGQIGAEGSTTSSLTNEGSHTEVSRETSTVLLPIPGVRFAEISVAAIAANPRQPRSVFDEDELAELSHSIREVGVLQPVVVRPIPGENDRFELVMGERRLRATREAGLERIPAIIRETADDDLLRDALLENLHRSQLNPLEEAAAYSQLLEDFSCTHENLAERIGRSRPQISNTLRLLKLPPLVQRRVAAGVLSAGHARALLSLPGTAAMERLAQRVVAEGLSVRAVEEIVAVGGEGTPENPTRRPRAGSRQPELDDLAQRLSDRFDTRVQITLGRHKGKLAVEFATVDDLKRIVALLAPGDKAFEGPEQR